MSEGARTYIQLGKFGDIINLLPILKDDCDKGRRSRLMVAEQYASILEGCSYLDPVIFKGFASEIGRAVEEAKPLGDWVCTQVNGPRDAVAEFVWKPAGITLDGSAGSTPNFQQESWRIAGRLNDWNKGLPLVFDRRNAEREAALIKRYMPLKDSKYILYSLAGESSPFAHSPLLAQALSLYLRMSKGFTFIDVGAIKAERIYDLLGLFEKAHCLVSIDSALLHLAKAVPGLPVLALANDTPKLWNGTAWFDQCVFYCRYADFPSRVIEFLNQLDCLRYGYTHRRKHECSIVVTNGYRDSGRLRMKNPIDSGSVIDLLIEPGACGRNSNNVEAIGDPTPNPYLKDVLRMAIAKAKKEDWIVIRRPGVEGDWNEFRKAACSFYAYRIAQANGQKTYVPICDVFGAPRDGWRDIMKEIPDLVLNGDYFWSHALWVIFRKHGAVDYTGKFVKSSEPPKPKPAGEDFPPAVKHNSKLASQLIVAEKVRDRYPAVSHQFETVIVQGIFDHAYNPSVIEHGGRILMAYRYHPDPLKLHTRLAIAELDSSFKVVQNYPIVPGSEGNSFEDPRFFVMKGKLAMSWVNSEFPKKISAKVEFSILTVLNGKLETGKVYCPGIGKNDGTAVEKNWLFWDDYLVYSMSPKYLIYKAGRKEPFELPAPVWPYGPIRGGTVPITFHGKLIRFFHSGADTELDALQRRRYMVGAMEVEKDFPFKPIKISSRPIIYGSESDEFEPKERRSIRHWKKSVIFPGGAIVRENAIWLSVGVNDSACAMVRLELKDLNL